MNALFKLKTQVSNCYVKTIVIIIPNTMYVII